MSRIQGVTASKRSGVRASRCVKASRCQIVTKSNLHSTVYLLLLREKKKDFETARRRKKREERRREIGLFFSPTTLIRPC